MSRSPSLSGIQKPGVPRRAQLDPGTVLSPFKVLGSFLYHQKTSSSAHKLKV